MKEYLLLTRPHNCIIGAFAVFVVGIVSVGMDILSYTEPLIFGMLVVFTIIAGGNILNDYFDRENDAINHPERPLPSGKISPSIALLYSVIMFSLSMVFGFFISHYALFIASYAVIILILYESSLKKEGVIGNVAISLLVGMIFIFGGVIMDNIMPVLILACMAFCLNLGREIVKDIEDMLGDLDRKTLPMRIGKTKASIVTASLFAVSIALSPLPYFMNIFDIIYLMIVVIADVAIVYAAILILTDTSKSQLVTKIGMVVGLMAFLGGSLL